MPKGKKKAKRKPKRPRLSPLNKFLYWVLLILGIALVFSLVILFVVCQQQLGKANGAIAVAGTASALLLLIPLFPAIVGGIVFWEMGYGGRVPLIPSREEPAVKRKKKRDPAATWIIGLAVILWLLSFVPVIGAVYDRVEINATHIDTYAMFGRLEAHRPVGDAAQVHARIFYSSGRGSAGWRMSYTVCCADGESFTFQNAPSVLLEIDALFSGVPKTVEGAKYLHSLCQEYHCTEEVRAQLRELFLIGE